MTRAAAHPKGGQRMREARRVRRRAFDLGLHGNPQVFANRSSGRWTSELAMHFHRQKSLLHLYGVGDKKKNGRNKLPAVSIVPIQWR